MKRRILPVVLSGTAMAAAGAPAAAADWVRVDTPNFVVVGESGAKRVTQVAEQFERFREALARVLSASAASTPVPTTIVAFDALRSFGPYRPLYNGKPVQLNGYFASSGTHSVIALSLQNRDEALRTIFHEYTHLVAANAARGMPTWVSEGVAEYYSTFEIAGDGKTATLGRVIPEHLQQLNGGSLLKHEDLLEIDQESPLYNEGARRSLFYAQSWALVHMLLSGQPSRAKELATYAALTSAGTPSLEAWRQVFGTTDVARALREYVGQYRMRGYRFRFERELVSRCGSPRRTSKRHSATCSAMWRPNAPKCTSGVPRHCSRPRRGHARCSGSSSFGVGTPPSLEPSSSKRLPPDPTIGSCNTTSRPDSPSSTHVPIDPKATRSRSGRRSTWCSRRVRTWRTRTSSGPLSRDRPRPVFRACSGRGCSHLDGRTTCSSRRASVRTSAITPRLAIWSPRSCRRASSPN
jgi:hypothetical protein